MNEKHLNNLNNKQLEQLYILSEELGEAQQAVGKILRHGYGSFSPFDKSKTTNRANLERELADILFAMKLLVQSDEIDFETMKNKAIEKEEKVITYLHYQGN